MSERLIVIGGGGAGTAAATIAKRTNPDMHVTVFTEFEDIAYSPCGIPYVHGREIAEFESLFLSLVLTELRHSESDALARPRPRAVPYYVKRVEEFINLHADAAIALDDMVAVSGVSARSLFNGFRAFRGTGPMAYLKRVRLERVRAEVQDLIGNVRVIEEGAHIIAELDGGRLLNPRSGAGCNPWCPGEDLNLHECYPTGT